MFNPLIPCVSYSILLTSHSLVYFNGLVLFDFYFCYLVIYALISGHAGGLTQGKPPSICTKTSLQIPPTQGQYSSSKSYHCPSPGEHNLKGLPNRIKKSQSNSKTMPLLSVASMAIEGDLQTIALASNKDLLIHEGNSNSLLLQ